jgi:hypothetical protein
MNTKRRIVRPAFETRLRPASEARLSSVSESERVEMLVRTGVRVVKHRGYSWQQIRPGYYKRIHLLASTPARHAIRPSPLCWGFMTTLPEDDARYANATLPIHVLPDLAGFEIDRLSPRRRNKVRKSRREATLVQLLDSNLLREQGHGLYVSHLQRTRHLRIPSADQYLASIARITAGGNLIIAALVGSRLAGYVHGMAVDGVAYLEDVVVGTEFLGQQLGIGLNVEFILACQRSDGIHTLVHGLHAREDPGLDEFKLGLGLRVVHVPSRVQLPRPLHWYLRLRRPHKYYRLTGR